MSAAIIQFPGTAPQLEPEAPNRDEIEGAFLTLLEALRCGSLHPASARLMVREIVEDSYRIEQLTNGGASCLSE